MVSLILLVFYWYIMCMLLAIHKYSHILNQLISGMEKNMEFSHLLYLGKCSEELKIKLLCSIWQKLREQ